MTTRRSTISTFSTIPSAGGRSAVDPRAQIVSSHHLPCGARRSPEGRRITNIVRSPQSAVVGSELRTAEAEADANRRDTRLILNTRTRVATVASRRVASAETHLSPILSIFSRDSCADNDKHISTSSHYRQLPAVSLILIDATINDERNRTSESPRSVSVDARACSQRSSTSTLRLISQFHFVTWSSPPKPSAIRPARAHSTVLCT
ncbi:hypothetical protein V9T40_007381 [Parthenolecanium corni]|uniref:Uncharacterized protein n=1 Tax=Parthenolecanium corni TaxID=536013 RepID=A0AAN9Y9R2_9HEMI